MHQDSNALSKRPQIANNAAALVSSEDRELIALSL